jgi:hypothetical protein
MTRVAPDEPSHEPQIGPGILLAKLPQRLLPMSSPDRKRIGCKGFPETITQLSRMMVVEVVYPLSEDGGSSFRGGMASFVYFRVPKCPKWRQGLQSDCYLDPSLVRP